MHSSVVIIFFCVAFAAAENAWDLIPECAAAKANNFAVPGCPAMSPCIQAVHTKGQECVRLEAEDADAAACTNLDEVKGARLNWLKAGCKHHTALTKCMAGEDSTGFDAGQRFFARYRRNTPVNAELAQIASKPFGRCWLEVRSKLHECRALGDDCVGYNACAGKEPIPADHPWAGFSKQLRDKKEAAMHTYKDKMKACLAARAQPAVFL